MKRNKYSAPVIELVSVCGRYNIMDDITIHVSGVHGGLGDAKEAIFFGQAAVVDNMDATEEEPSMEIKRYSVWDD